MGCSPWRDGTRASAIAAFLVCANLVGEARADGSASAPSTEAGARPTATRVVAVVVAALPSERALVDANVFDLLDRLGVIGEVSHGASVAPADVFAEPGERERLARVWIDLTTPPAGRVFVSDGRGQRVLVRRIAFEGGSRELVREAALQVVGTAVEELLRGAAIGVSREEAARELAVDLTRVAPKDPVPSATEAEKAEAALPDAPPPVPVVRRSALTLDKTIAMGWETAAYAGTPAVLAHGPWLMASVGVKTPDGPLRSVGAFVAVHYRVPFESRATPLVVRFRSTTLRIGAIAEVWGSARARLDVVAGAGVDLLSSETLASSDTSVVAGGPRTRLGVVMRAGAVLRLDFLGPLGGVLGLSLDYEPLPVFYSFIEAGGARRVVLDAWHVRPALVFGVAL